MESNHERLNEFNSWVYRMATSDDNFMVYLQSFNIDEVYYTSVISPYLYVEHVLVNIINAYIERDYETIKNIADCVINFIESSNINIPQMTVNEFCTIVENNII